MAEVEQSKWASPIIDSIRGNGDPSLIAILDQDQKMYRQMLVVLDMPAAITRTRYAKPLEDVFTEKLLVKYLVTYRFRPTASELRNAALLDYHNFLRKVIELGLFPEKQN